ncbi:NAD(P)-dependent oxidoreductase [Thermomonospora catenispora]|uniref:NAD(P)-dependent oxidoreductase n=1 Tax=Thermomonospora catenispora TaxID=2493090 RepID=UPI00111D4FB6|nr:NAD(P)-dependent oxidoreductase [Thermomonospora catenispora]TNY34970.1 NAD(P)-dependent oxidoreductase [Thermomonospora catenispora]
MTGAKIAVLGTGIIGAPVARNLSEDFAVRVWNRTRAKAEELAGNGGIEVADTPAEAVAGAGVVVTVLKDGPTTLEVMREAASGLAAETIWIQLGTVGVTAIEELAEFAGRHGLVFYDAPVMGTKQPAESGNLVILASGPEDARAHVQPVFDVIGSRTVWVASRPGASSRLKLALNSLVLALTHGAAESLALAEALGVDPRLVIDVVAGGPLDSGYFQTKAAAMVNGDYEPAFALANAAKDTRLILEAARAAGVHADLAAGGLRRFERAMEKGHGDKDMAASYLAG